MDNDLVESGEWRVESGEWRVESVEYGGLKQFPNIKVFRFPLSTLHYQLSTRLYAGIS